MCLAATNFRRIVVCGSEIYIPPITPEQIITMLTNRYEPTVVIEKASGQPVAYANLYDKSEDHCWLGNVIVSPDHRGKGAVEELLNAIVCKAKENHGMKKLFLSCHNTNSRGLAFYYKHRNGTREYNVES